MTAGGERRGRTSYQTAKGFERLQGASRGAFVGDVEGNPL